jgi:hypothetical protein
MKYWVIEMEGGRPSASMQPRKGTFENADEIQLGENVDWSTPMLILQEVEEIKAIPVVTFTVKIQ